MKYLSTTNLSCLLIAMLPLTMSVNATEVYKTKNADGSPSFSDQAAPGAKRVEVGPTNSADSIDIPPPENKPKQKPQESAGASNNAQSEPTYEGNNQIYYDNVNRRQNNINSKLRRKESGNSPQQLPTKPGNTVRPVVRPAGHGNRAVHK